MSAQELLSGLSRLDALFGSPRGIVRAGQAFYTARRLIEEITHAEPAALLGATPQLRGPVLSLAAKLEALDRKQQRAAAAAAEFSADCDAWEAAGTGASAVCLRLGSFLSLEGDDPLKVASAARCLLRSGRAHLAQASRDAARGNSAAAVRHNSGAAADAVERSSTLLVWHLDAIASAFRIFEAAGQPGLLAEFSARVAPPEVLLPWLATVCTAVQAHPTALEERGILTLLANSLWHPLCAPAFWEHRQQLAASMSQARPLVAALASHALPMLVRAFKTSSGGSGSGDSGSGSGGDRRSIVAAHCVRYMPEDQCSQAAMVADEPALLSTANRLCTAMAAPALSAAMREQLGELGGATAVWQVARLASALPVFRPAAAGNTALSGLQGSICTLLFHLFNTFKPVQQPGSGSGGSGGSHASSHISSSGSVSSSSSSNSGGSSSSGSAGRNVSNMWRSAAWGTLRLLPWLRALLTSVLAQEAPDLGWYAPDCRRCCIALVWSSQLLADGKHSQGQACTSWEDAAAWLDAVHAVLQLVQLLAQLDARCRQAHLPALLVAAYNEVGKPHSVVDVLVDSIVPNGVFHVYSWLSSTATGSPHSEAGQPGMTQDLASHLWLTHSTGCRLLHWLGAAGLSSDEQQTCGLWAAERSWLLRRLLDALHIILGAADSLHSYAGNESGFCMPALLAAHWEAVQAAATLLPGTVEDGQGVYTTNLSAGLVLLATRSPLLVDTTMLSMLRAALAREELGWRAARLGELLACGRTASPLAAGLAAAGMLDDLMCAHLQPAAWLSQVDDVYELSINVLYGLVHGITSAINSGALGEQQQRAVNLFNVVQDGLKHVLAEGLPAEDTAAALHDLRQPGTELAGMLQQFYQQPEQVAGARLERAQAAAARSCAYLRCSNLGLEGGPAAGQGRGSMRCGKCRAVWYCGPGCSHPDWRGAGRHQKVCAALAAARQAQRGQQS